MAPPTILLVDPDRDSLTIYSTILRHHGFEVICSSDWEEAMQAAATEQPSLVLTELFLPATRPKVLPLALRDDPRTAHLPVVVISSLPERPNPYGLDLTGCAGYLTKPCLPSRLLEEVRRIAAPPPEVQAIA
jgi:CheY-like chemotaxis protein